MTNPRIGLVLGSGGARGLAHIVAFETFDRLGIKPVEIAGTSMGAILGAAYAAGYSGAALRELALREFRNRTDVMARLFEVRVGRFTEVLRGGFNNPVMIDAQGTLERFLPAPLPQLFEDLPIPLAVVAADIHRMERVEFRTGPLAPAVAASMAIPGLLKPVAHAGHVLIDGGAVDPLPVRAIREPVDLILAIDISRREQREESSKIPSTIEVLTRAFDLMQAALIDQAPEKIATPIYRIRAGVEAFGALDFFSARKILMAAEPLADEIEQILAIVSRAKAIAGPQKKT
jgi:NTE family protein